MRKNQLVLLNTNGTLAIDAPSINTSVLNPSSINRPSAYGPSTYPASSKAPVTRKPSRARAAVATTSTLTVVLDGEAVAALEQQLFHLDDSTRVIGFSGIAAARAALRDAQLEAA